MKRTIIISLLVLLLLFIPLIAMQFTDEVNWTLLDFVIAAILLFGTGLTIDLAVRKVKNKTYKILIPIAILLILFLIWAELAVGLLDTPFGGN